MDRIGLIRLASAVGVSVAMAWPAVPAFAYSKQVERACVGDYKRLCPQYKPGSPQLRACMEAKAGSISWGCIQALLDSGEVDRNDKRRVARR